MRRWRELSGFTLMELLAALLIGAIVLAGTLKTFASQSRAHDQQQLLLAMQQNLRVANDVLADEVQFANVGVPRVSPETWIPWVAGFTANPKITSSPTTLSIASATTYPIARLKSQAKAAETSLALVSAVEGKAVSDLVNTGAKRLISLDGEVFAHVKAVSGSTVTVNTQPTSNKNVGLPRTYPADTPVFRVDVRTYSVETNPATGKPALMLNLNDGSAKTAIAEGISALTVTPVGDEPVSYRVTLTATGDRPDPLSRRTLTRTISTEFAVRDYLNDFDDIGEDDEADDEEF